MLKVWRMREVVYNAMDLWAQPVVGNSRTCVDDTSEAGATPMPKIRSTQISSPIELTEKSRELTE